MESRTINPNDRPLGITDCIKLLTDVIILSKFFLIKPLNDRTTPSDAADEVCGHLLSLETDLKDPKQIAKKEICAQKFLTYAKADLFPQKLTDFDLSILHDAKVESGGYVNFLLNKKMLDEYVETYTKKKYQTPLKELIHRACQLCIVGFSSYHLLQERRQYDKDMQVSSPHDAKDILSSEKNKIINLVATLAKFKKTSTHAGDIALMQIEIMSDIEHLREKLNAIEMALLQKKNDELALQANIFLQYIKRKTQVVDERKEALVIANLLTAKKTAEERTLVAEKRLQILKQAHEKELKTQNHFFKNKLEEAKKSKKIPVKKRDWQNLIFPAVLLLAGILLSVTGIGALAGIAIFTTGFAALFTALGVGTMVMSGGFAYKLYKEKVIPVPTVIPAKAGISRQIPAFAEMTADAAVEKTSFVPMSMFKKQATVVVDPEKGLGLSLLRK